jgi:hypothetical protein
MQMQILLASGYPSYVSTRLGGWTCTDSTLSEMRSLPSVKSFAECKKSGIRQSFSLPSAALGKGKHTVN